MLYVRTHKLGMQLVVAPEWEEARGVVLMLSCHLLLAHLQRENPRVRMFHRIDFREAGGPCFFFHMQLLPGPHVRLWWTMVCMCLCLLRPCFNQWHNNHFTFLHKACFCIKIFFIYLQEKIHSVVLYITVYYCIVTEGLCLCTFSHCWCLKNGCDKLFPSSEKEKTHDHDECCPSRRPRGSSRQLAVFPPTVRRTSCFCFQPTSSKAFKNSFVGLVGWLPSLLK